MNKFIGFLVAFSILLSACAGSSPQLSATPTAQETVSVVVSPAPMLTAQFIPTLRATLTLFPSKTPGPPTPILVYPTYTPTFDARTVVTATPAPQAECPKVTSAANADLSFLDLSLDKEENRWNIEENILNFLNQYGAKALYDAAKSAHAHYVYDVLLKDLNNDGEPEIALGAKRFFVFGCKDGQYEKLLDLEDDAYLHPPKIFAVKDVNRDGIPEITLLTAVLSQGGHTYQIYAWNGERFANLLIPDNPSYPDGGEIWVEATGEIQFQDTNRDSIQELILNSGIPVWTNYYDGLPWRNEQVIYSWNGKNYLPSHWEYAKPEFRFQAVQDADLAVAQDEYAKAMDLYQQTIFSDQLKNYSPEIRANLQANWQNSLGGNPGPSPTPVQPDPTEYPRLAAYAYYRMVILHTYLGEMEAAKTKYATLQEKFPAGNPGHPYVEIATAFWDAYQSSGKIYQACDAAITYTDKHLNILSPISSDYHGWQSYEYISADVCPFR